MKTVLRTLVVLLVLGGAGLWGWLSFAAPKAVVVPPTVPVSRGAIEQTVLATGVLQASKLVSVGAEVSGRIEELHVALGDSVREGEVIARIDSLNQTNALKAAEAALANTVAQQRAQQANVTQLEQALSRAEQLRQENLMSEAEYGSAAAAVEAARAQLDSIAAQIQQATLEVESARLDLSRAEITAPISGTVVAVLVGEGQSVNAAQASPTIVKLAMLDTMIIKAQISEADVTRVAPGQRVYFTILGDPDTKIDATLLSIDPAPAAIAADDAAGTGSSSAVYYDGLFQVPNPDGRLRIAMTAQVTIVLDEQGDALLVPASALAQAGRGGKAVVQVYDEAAGLAQPREVTVGINNNIMAEIREGLEEGEQVVASGGQTGIGGNGNSNGGGFGAGRRGAFGPL